MQDLIFKDKLYKNTFRILDSQFIIFIKLSQELPKEKSYLLCIRLRSLVKVETLRISSDGGSL